MAFTNGLGDRPDDLRFRGPQSPRDETSYPPFPSPLRTIGSQMQAHTSSSNDARASLHRRFTTNTLPTLSPLSPIAQQRRQAVEQPTEFSSATYHKVQLLEKKKLEYEFLREQRRRFEAEMELIDLQARREEDEMNRLANDLNHFNMAGHQSEPTTPPEYRDNGFPSALSRPNRFSSASLASPPGIASTRQSRSGSQITSPSTATAQSANSKSVPNSRRGSDEADEPHEYEIATMNPRTAAHLNRNSMPVTGLPDLAAVLGHIDTTSFLFNDDDKQGIEHPTSATSPDVKTYMQMNQDNFPTLLVRRNENGNTQLSASHAALDLALSQSPKPEQHNSNNNNNGWNSFARHRPAQHSLPMNTLRHDDLDFGSGKGTDTPPKANNRRSMEVKFAPFPDSRRNSLLNANSAASTALSNGMPKLQSSYSMNDIPTVKNPGPMNGVPVSSTVNNHAEQHLHNHNASLGRIPPSAMNNRHSRELSGADARIDDQKSNFRQISSLLHANAPTFGPNPTFPVAPTSAPSTTTAPASQAAAPTSLTSAPSGVSNPTLPNSLQYAIGTSNATTNSGPLSYYAYSMLNMPPPQNPVNMAVTGPNWNQGMSMYQNPYGQYLPQPAFQSPFNGVRPFDSQARVIQARRQANNEENNRFANFDIEAQRKQIVDLCRDQHGCRFLQRKLEEHETQALQIIFEETKDHMYLLMTDPFGNYLCQKLLEHTNDAQRTMLINNAAPGMIPIATNQHGTRALQKMIEHISTPEQIQMITFALKEDVVGLIKDLNGNHVIQKCLNHLTSENAQFIYDAVGAECVAVGTHRHGCCVLQRCIDHASEPQRAQLVKQITDHSYSLVQDPFGNYVVQYILDLCEAMFTTPLCTGFRGRVIELSKQKFSSNVIEKCIRVADFDTKCILIEELLNPSELNGLIRDSYANYVMQTALEHSPRELCIRLIENIRPLLPSIRSTPYGRRMQTKIQEREQKLGLGSGQMTPRDGSMTPQTPRMGQAYRSRVSSNATFQSPPNYMVSGAAEQYTSSAPVHDPTIAAPQPHRLSNPPLPSHLQNAVQQNFYGRGGQPGFPSYI